MQELCRHISVGPVSQYQFSLPSVTFTLSNKRMSCCVLLLIVGVISLLDGVSTWKQSNNDVDENINLIEPTSDLWLVLNKPRGKSTFKNIIQSLQIYESRNKVSGKKKNPDKTSLIDVTSISSSSTENSEMPTTLGPVNGHKMPHSLHLNEQEKKKFHHSILEGWAF